MELSKEICLQQRARSRWEEPPVVELAESKEDVKPTLRSIGIRKANLTRFGLVTANRAHPKNQVIAERRSPIWNWLAYHGLLERAHQNRGSGI